MADYIRTSLPALAAVIRHGRSVWLLLLPTATRPPMVPFDQLDSITNDASRCRATARTARVDAGFLRAGDESSTAPLDNPCETYLSAAH